MEAFERYEHAGCVVELHYDPEPMSPREWDQLGTIVTWGRDGGWGDEDLGYEPYEYGASTIRWAVDLRRARGATKVLPVRWSDYGSTGSAVHIVDDWDDANAVIFDTPKGREMTGCTEIADGLRAEIEEMDTWARGEVYGYVVETLDGNVLDSCWGFMGDDGLKEARNEAESYAEDEARATEQIGFYQSAH